MLINLVAALRVLPKHRRHIDISENDKDTILTRILNAARQIDIKRRINAGSLQQAQNIYSALAKRKHELRNHLRQGTPGEPGEDADVDGVITQHQPPTQEVGGDQAAVVETELMNALTKQSSALLERPYVEKKGRNDFLVMKPDIKDPFVTVIPNAIYYNIEKKCVNWLDDCSLQGIRNQLLRKVKSPF
ncbi:hypothetical protein ABMA27_000543 [Loxostege sticticalis]|uniref:Uncharacterized protein n=1 Tax=Loxostege sticticalis TaxID=481309 RepID=A0ABR3INR8_LOXSC